MMIDDSNIISFEKAHGLAIRSVSDLDTHDVITGPVKGKVMPRDENIVCLKNGYVLFCDASRPTEKRVEKCINVIESAGGVGRRIPATKHVVQYLTTAITNELSASNYNRTYHEKVSQSSNNQILTAELVRIAYEKGSSDIYIFTNHENNTTKFCISLDSKMRPLNEGVFSSMPADKARSMLSTMVSYDSKISGTGESEYDERREVDCSFDVQLSENTKVSLRYNHIPQSKPTGLAVTMRLIDGSTYIPSFAELGYSAGEQGMLEYLFKFPDGILFFTGPTGSGKSTAMQAGIETIPRTKKIISIEDPVEKAMKHVCQVQVRNESGPMSYESLRRAFVRQAPHVGVFGESRDVDGLNGASRLAETGHLIITTLHTKGAPESIDRMHGLGISWDDLAQHDLIRGIIAQRLIPKLCPSCSIPILDIEQYTWVTSDHLRIRRFFEENHSDKIDKIRVQNMGEYSCETCHGRGETGRRPVVEILIIESKDREYIRNGDVKGWIRYLEDEASWKRMFDKATKYVLTGDVCPVSAEGHLASRYGSTTEGIDYEKFERDIIDARRELDDIKISQLSTARKAV